MKTRFVDKPTKQVMRTIILNIETFAYSSGLSSILLSTSLSVFGLKLASTIALWLEFNSLKSKEFKIPEYTGNMSTTPNNSCSDFTSAIPSTDFTTKCVLKTSET